MKGVQFSQVEERALDAKWQRVGVAKVRSCRSLEASASLRCRKVAAFQMRVSFAARFSVSRALPSAPLSLCFPRLVHPAGGAGFRCRKEVASDCYQRGEHQQ